MGAVVKLVPYGDMTQCIQRIPEEGATPLLIMVIIFSNKCICLSKKTISNYFRNLYFKHQDIIVRDAFKTDRTFF